MQDTAASISVIGGDIIDDLGIVAITEIFDVLPGVTFNEPPGGLPSPTIRGIGTSTANQAFEQSVGLFQDGVYKPRSSQYTNALFDVERVEVVRGGQGVIFGKNTSVGAISVISRKPGDVFGGEVSASYEPVFGGFSAGATVDIPASDELKFRLGGEYRRAGGFVENLTTGNDDQERDNFILRATAEYDPAGPFKATLLGQYSEVDATGSAFQNISIFDDPTSQFIAALFGGFVEPVPLQRTVAGDSNGIITFPDGTQSAPEGNETESFDAALTLEYDLGSKGKITSITSYSEFDYSNVFDVFGTTQVLALFTPRPPELSFPGTPPIILPLLTLTQNFDEDFSQFTQELRHNFESGSFRLTSGVFFQLQDFTFEANNQLVNLFQPGLPPPITGGNLTVQTQDLFDQELWSASVFAQAGIDLSDRLTLEAGVRVGREEKEATLSDGNIASLFGLQVPNFMTTFATTPGTTVAPFIVMPDNFADEINDTTIDGSVTLSYDLNDDILVFASASQGTKSGGFTNAVSPGVPFVFEEEVARAIELGVKGGFANGRGYFSLTGFYTDIENFQDSVFNSMAGAAMAGAFQTVAFDADNIGLEAEGRFQLTDDLVLGGSIAYLDAEASDTGSRLARAPEFTSSWTADFDRDISNSLAIQLGGLLVTNSGQLHRQTPIDAAPLPVNDPIESGSYQLLDLYAGFRLLDSGIQFRAEVKNVTDELFTTFAFPSFATSHGLNGAFNRPRSVNLSVRVPFGG